MLDLVGPLLGLTKGGLLAPPSQLQSNSMLSVPHNWNICGRNVGRSLSNFVELQPGNILENIDQDFQTFKDI